MNRYCNQNWWNTCIHQLCTFYTMYMCKAIVPKSLYAVFKHCSYTWWKGRKTQNMHAWKEKFTEKILTTIKITHKFQNITCMPPKNSFYLLIQPQ